jgi:hypothetical protein
MGALDIGSLAQPWGVANGLPYCIWVIDTLPAVSVINLLTAAREKLLTIVAFEALVRLEINLTGSLALPILMEKSQKTCIGKHTIG